VYNRGLAKTKPYVLFQNNFIWCYYCASSAPLWGPRTWFVSSHSHFTVSVSKINKQTSPLSVRWITDICTCLYSPFRFLWWFWQAANNAIMAILKLFSLHFYQIKKSIQMYSFKALQNFFRVRFFIVFLNCKNTNILLNSVDVCVLIIIINP
jgi:hypothetical protein